MEEAATSYGVILKTMPVEAHNRIGKVERSHSLLCTVYEKLKLAEFGTSRDDLLSMSFRGINDAPGAGGVSPTVLVFGVHLKIPGAGPRGSMAERANVIRECTHLVIEHRAKRMIRDSIRNRNQPDLAAQERVRTCRPGSQVLVYREKGGWTPYRLVRVVDNEVHVVLPSGKISSFSKAIDTIRSQAEIQDLGCFQVVDKTESGGHRLYMPTFVDKVRSTGEKKSRLCVAACNGQDHGLLTGVPTVKRMYLRLLSAIAVSAEIGLFTRDVSKAFVQSDSTLQLPVYMQPLKEMPVPAGKILKVVKPLYVMPESPMHWYKTYLAYHRIQLGMEQFQRTLASCTRCPTDASTGF